MNRRTLLASLLAAPLVPVAALTRVKPTAPPQLPTILEYERLRTALMRQMLDNMYMTAGPVIVVSRGDA